MEAQSAAGSLPGYAAFAPLLQQIHGEQRRVLHVEEQPPGEQGASGAQVRYWTVTSSDSDGCQHQETLVTKTATLLERRVVQLLAGQGCAVPPTSIPDVDSEERAPIHMPYLGPRPPLDLGHPASPLTLSIADGLAGIHAANRLQPPAWLPHVHPNYRQRLWLHAWRTQWEANLTQPEFAQEFGSYTARLDAAMEHLLAALSALEDEGTSLTLLNVDLIPEHIRLWRGAACFIDWEQVAYGTLYLDLPNYFLVETALTYRDALERRGHSIPVVEFLERYHEVSRYMGLRYLGYSLWRWAQGGTEREAGRWFLYYTFSLALFGR